MNRKAWVLWLVVILGLMLALPAFGGKRSRFERCQEGCRTAARKCAEHCAHMPDSQKQELCLNKGCKIVNEECAKRCEKKRGK